MTTFRKIVSIICLAITLGYAATALLGEIVKPRPVEFASVHSFGELSPIMCFASDSVFNIGSAKDLDALPNIGEVLSQRIVDYRELWGDYRIPEDLMLVKGIGEKTMNSMMEVLDEPMVPRYPGE